MGVTTVHSALSLDCGCTPGTVRLIKHATWQGVIASICYVINSRSTFFVSCKSEIDALFNLNHDHHVYRIELTTSFA